MRLRVTIFLAVAFAVGLIPGTVRAESADARYAAVDEAMRTRVSNDQLDGGALLAMRDDTVLHETAFGDWPRPTAFPIASASKWLTSATLMSGPSVVQAAAVNTLVLGCPGMRLGGRSLLRSTDGVRREDEWRSSNLILNPIPTSR